jgi:hypothetical protein
VIITVPIVLWKYMYNKDDNNPIGSSSGNSSTVAGIPRISDREALLLLYNDTNGNNWVKNTNWGSTKPISEWHGVKVNRNGRVYKLILPRNNMNGA